MTTFLVDVITADGELQERHKGISQLGDACGFAFALADKVSAADQPRYADVRWIRVFEDNQLAIAISVQPGIPMIGLGDRRRATTS